MNNHQITAYLYIVLGFFLVLFFGGKLIVQVVAICAGLLLMKQGFAMLSLVRSNFFNGIKF